MAACKNHFGKADNIKVVFDRVTGEVKVFAEREIVNEVEDPVLQISREEAILNYPKFSVGDVVQVEVTLWTYCSPKSETSSSAKNP